MASSSNSVCEQCGHVVRWVRTTHNKWLPIDPAPIADGNIVVIDGVAHILGPEDLDTDQGQPPRPRYKSHRHTCPLAAQERPSRKVKVK